MAGNHNQLQPIQDHPLNLSSTSTGSSLVSTAAAFLSMSYASVSAPIGNATVSAPAGSCDISQTVHPQANPPQNPHWGDEIPPGERVAVLASISYEIQSLRNEEDVLDKDLEKTKRDLMNLEEMIAETSRDQSNELMRSAGEYLLTDYMAMYKMSPPATGDDLHLPMQEMLGQMTGLLKQKMSAIVEKQSELGEQIGLSEVRELVPKMVEDLKKAISEQVNTTLMSTFLRLQEEAQNVQAGHDNVVPEVVPDTVNDTTSMEGKGTENDSAMNVDNEGDIGNTIIGPISLVYSGQEPVARASTTSGLYHLMSEYEDLMSEEEEDVNQHL